MLWGIRRLVKRKEEEDDQVLKVHIPSWNLEKNVSGEKSLRWPRVPSHLHFKDTKAPEVLASEDRVQ